MTDSISLHELNSLIKLAFRECFPNRFWVKAELSEVRTNASGHCYVEFIEKDKQNGNIIAKMRGNIWANTFRILKPYFENETDQIFAGGIKVLVQVNVDYHEVYGPSLTVTDIDPTFTLGDMLKQKLEIIKKLKAEGLFDLNKKLALSPIPQKLAVISSSTAAGLDDFINQLKYNSGKYSFYTKLFPAIMQGDQAEMSILNAFDLIEKHISKFDAMVIIRGGGAVSDLNCFDSYLLGKRCAQFGIPIITGIGHERDESVLDLVVHTRTKTPTAAAEFLISCFDNAENELVKVRDSIVVLSQRKVELDRSRIQSLSVKLSHQTRLVLNNERIQIYEKKHFIEKETQKVILNNRNRVEALSTILKSQATQIYTKEKTKIDLFDQIIKLSSPETMLKKGFSLTLKNDKIVRSVQQLAVGDRLTTIFADGEIHSEVSPVKIS